MVTCQIRIGEHLVRVDSESAELAEALYPNFRPLPLTPDGKADIHLLLKSGYGVPYRDHEVKIAKEADRLVYLRADYRIDTDSDYRRATVSAHDSLALRHALMTLYSSFIVKHRWGLLLHASCVVEQGLAYLFTGRSGAGKSTAARLSRPRLILADEATLMKITPFAITVYNSPFRSEWAVTGEEHSCPAAGIFLLNQAPHHERIGIARPDSLLRLLDKAFYWAHTPEESGHVLPLLKRVVEDVPVDELHFQKNNGFWGLISS